MTRTIRIDDDVYEGLKKSADPFEDTPNTVIRKLLIKANIIKKTTESTSNSIRSRAKRGVLTPQAVYEEWLLHTLWHEFHGKAHKADVTKATIRAMQNHNLLIDEDFGEVPSGGQIIADNKIAWGRNELKKLASIRNDSRFGTWELTEKGIEEAKRIDPPKNRQNFMK